MMFWRPVPQALIAELLMYRWTRDNPAPDAVGYMVALDRLMAGSPLSARKLADYAGWTRWHANQTLVQVRAFNDEWDGNQPTYTAGHWPPISNESDGIQTESGQKPARNQPDSGHHARAVYKNTTEQEHHRHIDVDAEGTESLVDGSSAGGGSSSLASEPLKSKEGHSPIKSRPRVDLDALWDRMEDVRLESNPGSRRAKLGRRRIDLGARVNEHGEDAVEHCWRWFWNATEHRAQFLRQGGYGISTFLRPGKLRDYMDRSSVWDPSIKEDIADWYNEDEFDEHGNLRAPQ